MILYTDEEKKIYVEDKPLGSGGEGVIYAIKPSSEIEDTDKFLVKVYKVGNANRQKLELLRNVLRDTMDSISFPFEILYDRDYKCRGYLMHRFSGVSLHETVFIPKLVKMSGWNRVDLALLAKRILKLFVDLHSVGILMGDINPFNILVNQQNLKPYFIDVDSYQTFDAPCPVYTEEFLSPRLTEMGVSSGAFFREMEDEYYAISVLLFKIFLISKNPYARSGEGSLQAHIIQRNFVFPRGYDNNQNMPRGPWQRIWYNMPERMRTAFYEAFHDGIYLKPVEWLDIVEDYEKGLREGTYPKEIFPNDEKIGLGSHLLSTNHLRVGKKKELVQFINHIEGTAEDNPNYALVEFGTDSIKCFEYRYKNKARMEVIRSSHFDCVDENGMMNLETFRMKLDAVMHKWVKWKKVIESYKPPYNYIYAYGGALLRNLVNREEVIAVLYEKLGITFGLHEVEDEINLLAEYAGKSRKNWNPMVTIDVSGAAALYCRFGKGKVNGYIHEYDKLGSKLLVGYFFSTSSVDTRLDTKLYEHDLAVEEKIRRMNTRQNSCQIMAFGIIQDIRGKESKNNMPETWSLSDLKEYRDNLTEDLTCNRQLVKQLYKEIYESDSRLLARKLELRLAIMVYIKLMEQVQADSLLVMPMSSGELRLKRIMKEF